MSAKAAARARKEAEAAKAAAAAKRTAEEAEARTRMRKMLEAEEVARRKEQEDAEMRARRMRDKWRKFRDADDEAADDYILTESDEENDEDDESLAEWVTDEILEHRTAKEVERDEAVRTILKARSLTDALGLTHTADEGEVNPRVRKLLQLLHPDFAINLAIKGTKKQLRIEAAFKKLNGLRGSAT